MKMLLYILWGLSVGLLISGKFIFDNMFALMFAGGLSAIVYIILLSLRLFKDVSNLGPDKSIAQPIEKKLSARLKSGAIILAIIMISIALSIAGQLFITLVAASMFTALYMIIKNSRLLGFNDILISVLLSLVVLAAMLKDEPVWIIFNTIPTIFMYLAGVILIKKTDLFQPDTARNKYIGFAGSIGMGGLLVVPTAILNSFADMGDDMITRWWHTIMAIKPAIFEEVFIRFFLLTYFIYLYSKGSEKRSVRLFVPVILSSLLFTLLHGFNPMNSIIMLLIFSIPAAVIYLKHGLAAAVAAHFVIDFFRYLAALYLHV